MELDLVNIISQTGFPIGVCIFLLWKSYAIDKDRIEQDKKYLIALERLSTLIEQHIEQKDAALAMLKER